MSAASAGTLLSAAIGAAGLDWIVPDWPAPANVGALLTTRHGGVSVGPYATMNLGRGTRDDPQAVAENERRFRAFLPGNPAWLDQVHGATVVTLTEDSIASPAPAADAAVTRAPGMVCAIRTADCLAVLFADEAGTAVGIAHAGWRGMAEGVLEATIAALRDLGVRPGNVMAWLGPAIGPSAFEVGDDVRDAFRAADPGAATHFAPHGRDKWLADLYGLARQRLARGGVTSVGGGERCTFTEAAQYHSYRRERESGRMAAAIWLAR
jgi:YfiH family protein